MSRHTAYPKHGEFKFLTVWQLELHLANIFRFLHHRHVAVCSRSDQRTRSRRLLDVNILPGRASLTCVMLKCQVSKEVRFVKSRSVVYGQSRNLAKPGGTDMADYGGLTLAIERPPFTPKP